MLNCLAGAKGDTKFVTKKRLYGCLGLTTDGRTYSHTYDHQELCKGLRHLIKTKQINLVGADEASRVLVIAEIIARWT